MASAKLTFACSRDDRLVQLPEELTVYADEQGTSQPSGGDEFAVGLAFAPRPIEKSVVDAALAQRAPDHRCARRAYFHSSADCAACQAASRRLVRETLGDVFFSSLRWRFDRSDDDHPHKGELHNHMIALALNHIAQGHGVRRIRLHLARVKGLSDQTMRARLAKDVEIHLQLMVMRPAIPHAFIEIVPEHVGPDDPGVQVVDRILWQERRGDMDSLGLLLSHEVATDGPFTIRHYAKRGTSLAVVPHRAWGRPLGAIDGEERVFLLREIERAIHALHRESPPELGRLMPIVGRMSRRFLNDPRIGLGDLEALCRTFLLVVDTVPLYTPGVQEQGQRASEAAEFAAAMVQMHESWTVTLADHWIRRRAWIIGTGQGACLVRAQA
jgi:hypothetical protein